MAKIKKISADSAYNKRFFYPQESAVEKPFNWKQMARLLNYLKPYMKTLVPMAMAAMLVNMVVRLTVPILIGDYVVDRAIADRNTTLLTYLIIGIAVLYLANYMANRYRIKIVNTLGQKTIYDLRKELFSHVQRLSHNFFDNRSAGSILVRILNDVNSLQ